ncbi:MAG TPA: hypothetical protein VFQ53_37685 [Kofleriaceae bacterium]|nr:hypothetical protein [Kofleriaceae bacterium]
MLDLQAAVDELWTSGVGPDDRTRVQALVDELQTPGHAAHEANQVRTAANLPADVVAEPIGNVTPLARAELAQFRALIDLMLGTPIVAPPLGDGPPPTRVLATSVAIWAAALARDPDALDRALATLERQLAQLDDDDPRTPIARAWADLALGEAALAAADRTSARHRLEAVSRGNAPIPLRVAATLRIVTLLLEKVDLEQARARCRQAASLAARANRPLHAQHARITGAMLDFVAGDAKSARKTLRTEADAGGALGLLPRIVLSAFEPPERAMPLLAEGLREAGERGDPFAFTICTLVGARRYAALDRDADALLTLTTAILQLREPAPSFAATLEDERTTLRTEWGPERYAAAERAALALLDAGQPG